MSFSEMLEVLGVSSSFLNYHLENLGELVVKADDGKYKLSSFGEAAMSTMTKVEDIPTTASQQSPQTKPKRFIRRSVTMTLGIICILLIASMGGTLAYYTMIIHDKDSELASANTAISQLNTNVTNLQNQDKQLQMWLDGNETTLNHTQANNTNLQDEIDSLNSNVTKLQNELNNFHITENSTVWLNGSTESGSSVGTLWVFYAPYAGYVLIQASTNSNSTYLTLLLLESTQATDPNYTSPYAQPPPYYPPEKISVGFGRTIVVPVPPSTNIIVGFESIVLVKETITMTYYY
jgi:hypothetical protein